MTAERQADEALVSVIVPVHNQRERVAETIACLERQSHAQVEAIYVDDGSTDGSGKILDKLVGEKGRVIHQANQGRSGARNRGLWEASGEFIQFLDGDDLISEHKLAHDVAYLQGHPEIDVVTCEACYFRNSVKFRRYAEEVKRFEDWFVSLLGGCCLPIHGPLLRREVLARVKGFEEGLDFGEDWDFWLRCAAAGTRAVFVPGVRAFYRLRAREWSGEVEGTLRGAGRVLSRVRLMANERGNGPASALALLASHTTWSLQARAAGREELAKELRQEVADWPERIPTGFEPGEYAPAEQVKLWTRVLEVFGDEASKMERGKQEWGRALERVGQSPDAAGIRALVYVQQTLGRSRLGERVREEAGRAEMLAKELYGQVVRRGPRSGTGAQVEEVLRRMRQEGVGRILIYGAGEHTRWLLTEFDLGDVEIAGIVDDNGGLWGSRLLGMEVMSTTRAGEQEFEGVLISSDQYEARLAERARRMFAGTRVYGMYEGGRENARRRQPVGSGELVDGAGM